LLNKAEITIVPFLKKIFLRAKNPPSDSVKTENLKE
jgi:hypothetical protein